MEETVIHNEELHNLYSTPNASIIRMIKSRWMRWAGHVAYGILIEKPDGKRPVGRPRLT
jgi:hypothetical protein